MIPDPSYDWVQAQQRAISMADDFVAQTRARTQAAMAQQQAAFTGGVGGAQPGVMSFAANMAGALPSSMASAFQQQAQIAAMRGATFAGGAATLAAPAYNQAMEIGEGARYGGSLNRMRLSGLLATAYAPRSIFPHAGMAFGMEGGLRRQMAQEETSRRLVQGAMGGGLEFLDNYSMGISSFMLRRSGTEASLMTRMETERTLQGRLGFLRGGQYQSATGFGVRRGYLTEGAGRELMEGTQAGVADLQAKYGYNVDQMNTLTRVAAGAVDVTQIQQGAAGGRSGMRRLGGEIREIRETAAAMAREMQLSEGELENFFGRLKGVMRLTGSSIRAFNEENRRIGLSGPFSQQQVEEGRAQFMQMGRQAFMGGNFSTQAIEQALRVNQMRQTGTIRADTLLREGGGLDPQAMMQMTARRLQQQIGLVQGGGFSQELMLQQASPAAYRGVMGGAGFFETQASAAGAMIRSPFAMMMSRMSREGAQQVAFDAPMLAYNAARQMTPMMIGNAEEKRAQRISLFGRRMGFSVNTPAGMAEAVTRYEEIEESHQEIRRRVTGNAMLREQRNPSAKVVRRMTDDLAGLMTTSGASMEEVENVMDRVRTDDNLYRRVSGAAGYQERAQIYERALLDERAGRLEESTTNEPGALRSEVGRWGYTRTRLQSKFMRAATAVFGGNDWTVTFRNKGKAVKDINAFAVDRLNLGASSRDLSRAAFGSLSDWQEVNKGKGEFGMRRLRYDDAGRARWEVRTVKMDEKALNRATKAYRKAMPDRVGYTERDVVAWTMEQQKGKLAWTETEEEFEGTTKDLIDIEAEQGSAATKVDWRLALQSSAAVDTMRRKSGSLLEAMGLDLGKNATLSGVAEKLLEGKADMGALASDSRLRAVSSLVTAARKAGAGSGGRVDFAAFKDVSTGAMREYFKKYAATPTGTERMKAAGLDPAAVDKLSRADMRRAYGYAEEEGRKGFLGMAMTEAMNKSSRLMGDEPGAYGKPFYVVIKGDMRKGDEQKPGDREAG